MNLKNRAVNTKHTKKKILIVCEGARTEPDYFKSFRVHKQCTIVGAGSNTVSVVRQALREMEKERFSEVWCVFDRDSFPKARVKEALALAEQNNIKCAFSNESFELWYVLHFEYLDTKISRASYCQKLGVSLGRAYKKNDASIYGLLLSKQASAIKNAKKLERNMLPKGACKVASYPYTTVYKLVERLNKLASA
ncbi:MAG: RloB family protein [Pseudomonas sp.]